MKHLKYFENEKQFREINLKDLWNDYMKYKKEIIKNDANLKTSNFSTLNNWNVGTSYIDIFKNILLEPILKNKEIHFQKATNKFYGDTMYSSYGRVKNIIVEQQRDRYGNFEILICVEIFDGNIAYILSRFKENDGTPGTEKDVVKIYDSQITRIEDEINLLKNTDKYNL